jgi:hypothetical protein
MTGPRKCEDCGWTLQATMGERPLEIFKRELPVIHCVNCDKLALQTTRGHTPPPDAFRLASDFR